MANVNEKIRKPVEEFVKHQRNAAEEAGKAILSLLPKDFRTHGSNAVKQSVEGFGVVVDAVSDELTKGVDEIRKNADNVSKRFTKQQPAAKVEVEVQ
jgi:hypothetical protein